MKKVFKFLTTFGSGIAAGAALVKLVKKDTDDNTKKIMKFKTQFYMVNRWVSILQDNRNLSEYFEKNKYGKVAVYGLGTLGENLANDLKDKVVFAIDEKAAGRDQSRFPVYSMDDVINEEPDVVVVTPVFAFQDIQSGCEAKFGCPVISLEDVIDEIL